MATDEIQIRVRRISVLDWEAEARIGEGTWGYPLWSYAFTRWGAIRKVRREAEREVSERNGKLWTYQ